MSVGLRFVIALVLNLLVLPAWADWNYCRLREDRLVILDVKHRFVLKKGAGWTLADNTQKAQFEAWRTANALPADPAEIVGALPKTKGLPLAGQIELTVDSDAQKAVRFTIGDRGYSIMLKPIGTAEWIPETSSTSKVKDTAAALKLDSPTLLVKLAQKSNLLEQAAWAKVVERLQSGREFFTVTPRGVLWAQPSSAPSQVPRANTTSGNSSPQKETPLDDEAKKEPSGTSLVLIVGVAVGGVAAGVGVGYALFRGRTSSPSKGTAREGKLGALSHHEEQLVRKVRDEARTKGGDDEPIVGKMLESYAAYDTLRSELGAAQTAVQQLDRYRQYSEQFNEFDGQARKLKQSVTDVEAHLNTARRELEIQRNRVASLQSELNAANNRVGALSTDLESCYKLFDDFEKWQKNLEARLQKIMDQDDK